jgi:hypothetical protein
MRAQLAGWLLLTALLTGCAGGPVRDLAQRRAEAFEISTVEADALVTSPSGSAKAAGVAGAAGAGAAAGLTCGPVAAVCSPVFGLLAAGSAATAVLLDGVSTKRTHALADRLQAEAQPAAFIADIAERVRQDVGPRAQAVTGPRIQLALAVSRLELKPKFPALAYLLVWVEARAKLVDADGVPREVRQRYVHIGEWQDLSDLERRPDALAREVALARERLALEIARDLRR